MSRQRMKKVLSSMRYIKTTDSSSFILGRVQYAPVIYNDTIIHLLEIIHMYRCKIHLEEVRSEVEWNGNGGVLYIIVQGLVEEQARSFPNTCDMSTTTTHTLPPLHFHLPIRNSHLTAAPPLHLQLLYRYSHMGKER